MDAQDVQNGTDLDSKRRCVDTAILKLHIEMGHGVDNDKVYALLAQENMLEYEYFRKYLESRGNRPILALLHANKGAQEDALNEW